MNDIVFEELKNEFIGRMHEKLKVNKDILYLSTENNNESILINVAIFALTEYVKIRSLEKKKRGMY